MLDLPSLRAVERIDCDRMSGRRYKCQRRNKTACVLRHDHKNIYAPLLQQTQQLTRLIYSNAPGHTEDNASFLILLGINFRSALIGDESAIYFVDCNGEGHILLVLSVDERRNAVDQLARAFLLVSTTSV